MQYNIDTFIRQLQSSVAKRKYQLQSFEYTLYHFKKDYSVAKDEYFKKCRTTVDPEFLEYLYIDVKYWKKHLDECQGRHKKLVEQQKLERKMLAYFINEKRYMPTPTTISHVPASFLSPTTTSGEKEELLNTFREIAESIKRHPHSGVLVQEVFVKEEK